MSSKRKEGPFVWPAEQIADLCRRWKIAELSLFGSALRSDFGPNSDIDLLVRFEPEADWSLFDYARIEHELETLLGRKVDLVSRTALERSSNWIRRKQILETSRPLYAV
jgi:predicted nucleotidyltransferase